MGRHYSARNRTNQSVLQRQSGYPLKREVPDDAAERLARKQNDPFGAAVQIAGKYPIRSHGLYQEEKLARAEGCFPRPRHQPGQKQAAAVLIMITPLYVIDVIYL